MYSESGGVERLLHRPIFGGVFGRGRYALASMPCVSRGLHTVRYMVLEPRAGAVLSVSEDKVEALAGARCVLSAAGTVQEQLHQRHEQLEIWPDDAANEPQSQPTRTVSKRAGKRCSTRAPAGAITATQCSRYMASGTSSTCSHVR